MNSASGMNAALNASSAAYTARSTSDPAYDAQVRSADYTDDNSGNGSSGMAQVVSAAAMRSVDPQGQPNGSFEVKSNGAAPICSGNDSALRH